MLRKKKDVLILLTLRHYKLIKIKIMNNIDNKIENSNIYSKQYYDSTLFKRITARVKILRKMC